MTVQFLDQTCELFKIPKRKLQPWNVDENSWISMASIFMKLQKKILKTPSYENFILNMTA